MADPNYKRESVTKTTARFMNSIALITTDVRKLAEFYLTVFQAETEINDIHVDIPVRGGSIVIYAKSAAEKDMGFDFAKYHGTGLVKFSFSVNNVDAEYERLKSLALDIDFIIPPTTYPWGARSMHFRDLDGNIVCFLEKK